jgi:hypothetical protein
VVATATLRAAHVVCTIASAAATATVAWCSGFAAHAVDIQRSDRDGLDRRRETETTGCCGDCQRPAERNRSSGCGREVERAVGLADRMREQTEGFLSLVAVTARTLSRWIGQANGPLVHPAGDSPSAATATAAAHRAPFRRSTYYTAIGRFRARARRSRARH